MDEPMKQMSSGNADASAIKAKMFCPKCHSTVLLTAKFCPECGANLLSSEENEPSGGAKKILINRREGITLAIVILVVFFGVTIWKSSSASRSFPQPAQDVLQWSSGFSKSIMDQILESTGNSDYVGSLTFPGTAIVSSAPHGASYVSLTIKEGKEFNAIYALDSSDTLKFEYWISQDGQHLRPVSKDAQNLWLIYRNG